MIGEMAVRSKAKNPIRNCVKQSTVAAFAGTECFGELAAGANFALEFFVQMLEAKGAFLDPLFQITIDLDKFLFDDAAFSFALFQFPGDFVRGSHDDVSNHQRED